MRDQSRGPLACFRLKLNRPVERWQARRQRMPVHPTGCKQCVRL